MRLKTMDKAYRVLLYNNIEKGKKAEKTETLRDIYKEARNKGDFKNYSAALRYKIVELLASCFNQKNQYSNVFEFISYIKVISRDYLAKNYFIREAMYDVLKYLFDVMITPRGELNSLNCPKWFDEGKHQKLLSKIRNNNDENPVIEATLQYRIFKVITHRLAMMRYENMFQSKTIMKIVASCEAMFNGEKEINIGQENKGKKISVKEIFLALPPREEMITSYLASVKTATMEENDDAVCLTLWQQTEALAPNIEIAPEEEN